MTNNRGGYKPLERMSRLHSRCLSSSWERPVVNPICASPDHVRQNQIQPCTSPPASRKARVLKTVTRVSSAANQGSQRRRNCHARHARRDMGDMNNPRSAALTGQGLQGVAASSQRPPRPMERCLHLLFGQTLPIEHSTNAGTWDPLILPRLVVGGLPCRSALSAAAPASREMPQNGAPSL